jgi:PAS domain S-box-containing protein
MSNDSVSLHFQTMRRHLASLQQKKAIAWTEIDAILEDLHVIYEEMQTNLEEATVMEQLLLQQNQHYYDLFQGSPIAYLVTDVDGVILEANQAIAQLLTVPYPYLAGKPLILYVVESDRTNFRIRLNQLTQNGDQQVWQLNLCPRGGEAFAAHLQVVVSRTREGHIENLKIGIFNLSQFGQAVSGTSKVALAGEASKVSDSALVT